jgi:hypothetical protein
MPVSKWSGQKFQVKAELIKNVARIEQFSKNLRLTKSTKLVQKFNTIPFWGVFPF